MIIVEEQIILRCQRDFNILYVIIIIGLNLSPLFISYQDEYLDSYRLQRANFLGPVIRVLYPQLEGRFSIVQQMMPLR